MSISRTTLEKTAAGRGGGSSCTIAMTPERAENRGLAWLIGGFLICPCHLPLTLALAGAVVSGTAAAGWLRDHPYLAGAAITLVWMAATWRGIRHLRAARGTRTP